MLSIWRSLYNLMSLGNELKVKINYIIASIIGTSFLSHSHTMTPFDAPRKQAVTSNFSFSHSVFYPFG